MFIAGIIIVSLIGYVVAGRLLSNLYLPSIVKNNTHLDYYTDCEGEGLH